MDTLRSWFRPGRAFGALFLLVTLVAGEAADTRHHLAEQGCEAETHAPGERDDHCTCTGLHAISLGDDAPVALAPIEHAREYSPVAATAAPRGRRGASAAPRAPPRD